MLKMRKRETAAILLVCWLREEKNNLYRMLQNYSAQKMMEKRLLEPREKQIYKQTLCWSCKNAVGRCSWSEVDESKKDRPIKYEPVSGWVAIKTKKMNYNSYVVLSCPEFVPDDNYGGNFYE